MNHCFRQVNIFHVHFDTEGGRRGLSEAWPRRGLARKTYSHRDKTCWHRDKAKLARGQTLDANTIELWIWWRPALAESSLRNYIRVLMDPAMWYFVTIIVRLVRWSLFRDIITSEAPGCGKLQSSAPPAELCWRYVYMTNFLFCVRLDFRYLYRSNSKKISWHRGTLM